MSNLPHLHMLIWTLYQYLNAGRMRDDGCPRVEPILLKLQKGLDKMRELFSSHELAYANKVAERTLARNYGVRRAPPKTVVLGPSARRAVGKFLSGAGLCDFAGDMR